MKPKKDYLNLRHYEEQDESKQATMDDLSRVAQDTILSGDAYDVKFLNKKRKVFK